MLGAMGSLSSGANKRYRLEFYTQAFNALNHANPTGFSGVLSRGLLMTLRVLESQPLSVLAVPDGVTSGERLKILAKLSVQTH